MEANAYSAAASPSTLADSPASVISVAPAEEVVETQQDIEAS